MILIGYCYFIVLAIIAASGVAVPIRSRRMGVVYGITIKCLPCAVLSVYAWWVTSGGISMLWLLLLLYHAGSLVFSVVVIAILGRSRYNDADSQAERCPSRPFRRHGSSMRAHPASICRSPPAYWAVWSMVWLININVSVLKTQAS